MSIFITVVAINIIINNYFLTLPCSLQDFSSPARDGTWALEVKGLSPNPRTSREFPIFIIIYAQRV